MNKWINEYMNKWLNEINKDVLEGYFDFFWFYSFTYSILFA
jgi:hypothetical protein